MAISGTLHSSSIFQAATAVLCVLAVLVADVEGRHHKQSDCSHFSCGGLTDVSYPFRRQGDPGWCGVRSYELACTDTKATIKINKGTYYVTDINYTGSSFLAVDASLDMQTSCPVPRWDHVPFRYGLLTSDSNHSIELSPTYEDTWASFLNCSQAIRNNTYGQVDCLTTSNSFVYYVLTQWQPLSAQDLEASCGYLGMIPFGETAPADATFEDVVRLMRNGFNVKFPSGEPLETKWQQVIDYIKLQFRELLAKRNYDLIEDIYEIDYNYLRYLLYRFHGQTFPYNQVSRIVWCVTLIPVICRFVLAPLAVWIFVVRKNWKERITIDAVEKFLRMQLMLGPTRYSYTDIIAITSHFRDKLGQGGYGSVYKGVLLPGNVHVAVKMLENSSCNGEDFISEVSTIGRIHHVNVVRLVGFCSEEKRRALVYEYMPNGSLDKYIFSSEKTFSWDKLNEIALGIARGINYLHQGCDMQIVHFDIKPYNILLDSNFIPKVADFGLAKLSPRDNSFVPMSAMRGTIGYIAPEMISRCFGAISNKSDVYSFGMLLLEMVGGRRNADPNAGSSSQAYYPSWVYSQLTQQEVGEISDAVDMHELEKKLCVVGLWCIQMRSHDRPTMSEVIEMLEAGINGTEMPPRPFFCDDEHVPAAGSYYMSSEMTAIFEDEEGE
ncbi:unnamed protein product [Urochloa humidicola]